MSATVKIQAGLDAETGFPCLRAEGEARYVAFFPVVKLQVEQWLYRGGLITAEEPYDVTRLIDRLELKGSLPAFPENVKQMSRVSKFTQENLPGMLATNLTMWETEEDAQLQSTKFPTPGSEWGRVREWLHGDLPEFKEWERSEKFYSQFKTRDLVLAILQLNLKWSSSVRQLIDRFCKAILASEEMGLPFMSHGAYELVSEANNYVKLTATPQQSLKRPMVAGSSTLWPVLGTRNGTPWRPLLQQNVPVVGLRLWFTEDHLKYTCIENIPTTIEVESQSLQPSVAHFIPSNETSDARARLRPFVNRRRLPMANRCPRCYEEVDREIFHGKEIFWCYQLRDSETGKLKPLHSRNRPRDDGVHRPEPIDAQYLRIARKRPERIRTICLSGDQMTGKTIWLLSLLGITLYPAGKTLHKIFPKSWNFDRIECSLSALLESEGPNLLRSIDEMWVDGNVPERNPAKKRALRSPVIFKLSPSRRLLPASERELVLIFNDIAGELVADPPELIDNEIFRHLCATTDVVFLVPAQGFNVANLLLGKFAAGLAAQAFGGANLNLNEINLILAISQIDRLTTKTEEDQQLLEILLSEPHTLPADQSEAALRAYFQGMKSVHHRLEEWLTEKQPLLVGAARRFGSVRYCGFSSFGFQLIKESRKAGSDACLPFEPQPIRVADPLLWLLREQGMFNF